MFFCLKIARFGRKWPDWRACFWRVEEAEPNQQARHEDPVVDLSAGLMVKVNRRDQCKKIDHFTAVYMCRTKIGSNLNKPVWPVCPGGLTGLGVCRRSGMTNRSDRSRRSPSTIRVLNRFRSVNRISCGVSLPHPININGHGRLKEQPNRIYQKHIFYFFTFPLLFQPLHDVFLSSPWRLRTP